MNYPIGAIIVLVCAVVDIISCACTNQGLFPNYDDSTCQSFIFCTSLSDGLFIKKTYNCSRDSLFDPYLKTCEKNYVCSSHLGEIAAVTTSPDVDNCTVQGRFPVENDTTCTSYYFCYFLTSGKFLKLSYICPVGTRYNPRLQTCQTNYQCKMSTLPFSSTPKIGKFQCTKQGKFPVVEDIGCSTYYYCLFLPSGEEVQFKYRCSGGKKFDPVLQTCSENYICRIQTTDTQIISTTSSEFSITTILNNDEILDKNSFQCSSTGRFSVEGDVSCKLYQYCFYLPSGQLSKQFYKCGVEEKFDSVLQICTKDYECPKGSTNEMLPIVNTTTETLSGTTTSKTEILSTSYTTTEILAASTSTELSTFSASLLYNCTDIGIFPVEHDTTCRIYYYCFYLPNGQFGQQFYSCDGKEMFDPNIQRCTTNYLCELLSN